MKRVFITGGAGYVGAVLVPKLLQKGYKVKVLDLFTYGRDVFDSIADRSRLETVEGDICDTQLLRKEIAGSDAVIHLACISNDPTFALNPGLSRKVNYEAFEPLVKIAKASGVKRFIYASTCSVYGVSDAPEVTEDHPLVPLTDYNKYKGLCEPVLLEYQSKDFVPVIIRPATVCGYSPRQRFDLTVNILTNHAYNRGRITVFGGGQERPNIHIDDITDLYVQLLELPDKKIAGKTYNAGFENRKVSDLAELVADAIKKELPERERPVITTEPSEDIRSYRISSKKIERELGFIPQRTLSDAVRDLIAAFKAKKFTDPLNNIRYYNVKMLQSQGF